MDTAGGMDWQAKRLEGKVFTVRFIDSAGQIHLEETGIALLFLFVAQKETDGFIFEAIQDQA